MEVPEGVIEKTGLLECGILAVGGLQHPVPVRTLNVTDRPVHAELKEPGHRGVCGT